MKNLITVVLFILTIISLWTTAVRASEVNLVNQNDYVQCVDEVESQYLDEVKDVKGNIGYQAYNELIQECSFESEVKVNSDDLLQGYEDKRLKL
jgi:hypothetical protein